MEMQVGLKIYLNYLWAIANKKMDYSCNLWSEHLYFGTKMKT